jgi:hypothetical protein
MVGLLAGADGDSGVPTINIKNVDGGPPLGGAGAGDPGASTINVQNIDGGPPYEMPELEIRERPPLTLKNVDGGPLAGADRDPRASTINAKKHRWRAI